MIDKIFLSNCILEQYDNDFLRFSEGSSFLDLPDPIKNKKSLINVKNVDDDKCLLWSLVVGRLKFKSPEIRHLDRMTVLKKHENIINAEGVDFPATFKVNLVNELIN